MANSKVPTIWTKSSYSGQQGDCLEWRRGSDGSGVEIADSKRVKTANTAVTLGPDAWNAFVAAVAEQYRGE